MRVLAAVALSLFITGASAQEQSMFRLPPPANVMDLLDRNRSILNTSAQIETPNSYGSGTALRANTPLGEKTIIVTNHHVIASTFPKECDKKDKKCVPKGQGKITVKAWIVENGKEYPISYEAKVVTSDPKLDLAILILEEEWAGAHALVAPTDTILVPGEDAYVSGGAHGARPHVTQGLISLPHNKMFGRDTVLVSAPVVPGNSGGSLWIKREGIYYMAGIPYAIGVDNGSLLTQFSMVISLKDLDTLLKKADATLIR